MPDDALIIQHQDDAPPGLILDALRDHGLALGTARLDRGEPLPDPRSVTFAVALGSERAAYDQEPAWIRTEIEWLRAADEVGTPVLGVCFGAQTLAAALGGSVEPAARPERGWIHVSTVSPTVVPSGPWLTWHDDLINLPPEAELIAENENGPQAFRIRGHLGVQFHPEVTLEIVSGWVAADRSDSLDGQALLDPGAPEWPAARDAARELFSAFVLSARR